MNSGFGSRLVCAFIASTWVGASEAATAIAETSPTRLDGLPSGASADFVRASLFGSPTSVSLAAAKEIGESSSQLKVWLEEILVSASALTLATRSALRFRRKRRERNQRLQTLYEFAELPASLSARRAPRYLPTHPYSGTTAPQVLSRQIENAAEASVEFGRVLGVIYFDLGEPPNENSCDWDAERSELMKQMRKALRRTDHIAELSDREIVACIALLPGKSELANIAGRLRKLGQSSTRFAKAFTPEAGLAIYPACGYRGQELIDCARSDFNTRTPAAITYQPDTARVFAGNAS